MLVKEEAITPGEGNFPESLPKKLSTVQQKILRIILENHKKDRTNLGLTSYELRKLGIPGRTFDINRDFLLKNQLLKQVGQKRTGKQVRRYYEATNIGIFCLLRSLPTSEIDEMIPRSHNYLPELAANWNRLKTTYGKLLPDLFSQTMYKLELDYYHIGLDENGKKAAFGFWLIIDLPTQDNLLDIKIRKLLILPPAENKFITTATTFNSPDELGLQLLNTVVFLFFFMLKNPKSWEDYQANLILDFLLNYRKSNKDKIDSNEEKEECKKYKEDFKKIILNGKQEANKIINGDPVLGQLYFETQKEFSDKIKHIIEMSA